MIAPPTSQRQRARQRDDERQRCEEACERRQDHDELSRLTRGDLGKPGDPLLHHVPLQPVEPGKGGRQQPAVHAHVDTRRDRHREVGANAVVKRQRPRSFRKLSGNEPEPVIRHVHAACVPRLTAGVPDDQGNDSLFSSAQDARRAASQAEGERILRGWKGTATRRGQDRKREENENRESGDRVIG